jgi:NAD(P)-dependent dehydrogenase (short-subunit alcohol dehydrogenase family)
MRVAVVTGGARGIGAAVVRRLSRDGLYAVLLDVADDDGAKVMRDAAAAGPGCRYLHCDVAVPVEVRAAFSEAATITGTIDVLVNCAFWPAPHDAAEAVALADWRRSLDVTLTGSFLCCQAVFPYMRDRGGRIINFGSEHSDRPALGHAAYASAKGAVRSMTRVLAWEWGRYGISVNTVWPVAATPAWMAWAEADPDAERKQIETEQAIRRRGDPEQDVAPLVSFLASAESGWVTGGTITANGGRAMP